MNLSELAVRRPVAVSMFVIAILIFGLLALDQLGVDLYPDLQFPYITIATVYPGADPQTVQEEVSRPIEQVVANNAGLRRVEALSMENISLVTAEFSWDTPIGETLDNVRDQLGALALVLPADTQTPVVMQLEPDQLPVMTVALSTPDELVETTRLAEDVIRPRLEQVDGIAQVSVQGGARREIQVLYDSEKLAENDLTPAMLEQFLSLQNALVPAGVLENDGTRFQARIGNNFTDVQEIRDLVIGESKLPVIGLASLWPPLLHVKDVAEVVDGVEAARGFARIDGEPAVLIQIHKQPDANTVSVAQAIHGALDDLGLQLPGAGIEVVMDQSVQIVQSLRNLAVSGGLGALLAVLVLFLFLRNWRSIVVIGSAIPLSVVVTLVFMRFTSLNLNLMTLGGLALGTGMLVDNAIIVLENIFRHRSLGKPATEAAITGSREVTGAVIAATLTTVAVFFPIVFMETLAARFFTELGVTLALSLAASLLVALSVVPAMSRALFRRLGTSRVEVPRDETTTPGPLAAAYRRLLDWSLNRRAALVVVSLIVFVASLALWPRLGMQFLPPTGQRAVYVNIDMPPGTPLAETDATAREAESRLLALGRFEFINTQVGEQQQQDLLARIGDHSINSVRVSAFTASELRTAEMSALLQEVRQTLAGLDAQHVSVSPEWESRTNILNRDIYLQLRGNDIDTLEALARNVHDRLLEKGGDYEVKLMLAERQPELFFAVDQSRALIGGLTTGQIGLGVRNALTGLQATTVRQNGQTIPVVMRPQPDEVHDLDSLLNFHVNSPVTIDPSDTAGVRLSNVVEMQRTVGPQTIHQIDGLQAVQLLIRPLGTDMRPTVAAIDDVLAATDIPAGVHIEKAGITQLIDEAVSELGLAVVLALILVYMVMAAQFESWTNPLIIMITVPLAILGSLWALWLTGTHMSVPSIIGLIMLAGIVVNNGIVLVDYINQLRARGVELREAVVRGATTRLRPVLMTAVTTVGGMVPLALSTSSGAEVQAPLAIAVIGGLTTATLLTLLIVPCFYMLFYGRAPRTGQRAPRADEPMAEQSGVTDEYVGEAAAGRDDDETPSTTRPFVTSLLLIIVLGAGLIAPTPVRAQQRVSDLQLITGLGYTRTDGPPVYLLGAGWRARLGDTDWRLHFATSVPNGTPAPVLDMGVHGSWFQPISFAGYYELQGDFILRRSADGPYAASLGMELDAVLGNITGRIEFDTVDADFARFPWDVPGRLETRNVGAAHRHLRAELREQPRRELNLVREFQWARSRTGTDNEDALLLSGGTEVRTGGGWLLGQVGLLLDDGGWGPAFQGGFRFRPGDYSQLSLVATSGNALTDRPEVTATYEFVGEGSIVSTSLRLELNRQNKVLSTLLLQNEPHASGWQWQLSITPEDTERQTMFGLSTSF